MPNRFISLFIIFISLNLSYSSTSFAHAGVDHGDNCFVSIAGAKLRLGGFQAAEKIGGGKHYCRLFPETGTVIFTFEDDVIQHLQKTMHLKFLATESYWDLLFDFDNAFSKTLSQVSDNTQIEHNFTKRGLYLMEISLQSDELEPSKNNTQTFLFLVGFPIIKMLIFVALGFLLLLGFSLLKQLKDQQ
ncbi:MAG: hypothetical protein methR_P2947 [Methyloprofundus sp.]|nr:MAG: hypothetical protein methR_P2947 [Methyloprofundus sp.]